MLAISRDKVLFRKLAPLQKAMVQGLRNSLTPSFFLRRQQEAHAAYTQAAHAIYAKQIGPVLREFEGTEKLYVLPDGPLHHVPFELLLKTPPKKGARANYQNLAYLIRDLNISYAPSATLLFRERKPAQEIAQGGVLAFAPSYPEEISDSLQLRSLGKFRNAVVPLLWNQPEVRAISNHFDGKFLFSESASERQFNENIGRYEVLHLAMHALVDEEDPMNSKLAFSPVKDSLNDSYLHAFELYNKTINAQLTVLSACNTGTGELQGGEGLMSLARAFAHAGCPSVVMSHWQVDDRSSSSIMEHFYRYLAEGRDKDEALRLAKLECLEETSPLTAHPFYWNNFVVMGDVSPLGGGKSNKLWLWASIAVALAGGFTVWARSRKRNKGKSS